MFEDDYKEPEFSEGHRFFAMAFLVLQIGMATFLVWYFFSYA